MVRKRTKVLSPIQQVEARISWQMAELQKAMDLSDKTVESTPPGEPLRRTTFLLHGQMERLAMISHIHMELALAAVRAELADLQSKTQIERERIYADFANLLIEVRRKGSDKRRDWDQSVA